MSCNVAKTDRDAIQRACTVEHGCYACCGRLGKHDGRAVILGSIFNTSLKFSLGLVIRNVSFLLYYSQNFLPLGIHPNDEIKSNLILNWTHQTTEWLTIMADYVII